MQIREGRIHALLGENGAGKSTLMKILSGVYRNYEGEILYHGNTIRLKNEKDALIKGISIVTQELSFISELSIAENLYLGREPQLIYGMLNKKERFEKTKELLKFMNLDYNPNSLMGELSVAQCQMIEILKAISRNSKVIIMDEPTSTLTRKETNKFFDKIKELKTKGIALVFISHRLDEVFELCDDYTVLRDGRYIASGLLSDIDHDKLITMMVGREIADIYPKLPEHGNKTVLEVQDFNCKGFFSNINFTIREGEILGLAGMMGAGRSEIARAIFGMDKKDSGSILLEGKNHHIKSVSDAVKAGIAMVTEDRAGYGIVGIRSIEDNVILPNSDLYSENGILQRQKIKAGVKEIFDRLSIKATGIEALAGNLSGGNQQKVVLAKWLVRDLSVLILDEPTRGIDVGAKQEIYKLIIKLAREGMAILLISSDMPEVLSMSHRILVISGGKIAGEVKGHEATQDNIMKKIVGVGLQNEK